METDLTVTILKTDYNRLIDDSGFLDALHAAGVDNWDGYEEALKQHEMELTYHA